MWLWKQVHGQGIPELYTPEDLMAQGSVAVGEGRCFQGKMFVFGVSLLSRQSPSKELIANPSSLIEENTSNGCETWTPSNFRKLLPHFREKKKKKTKSLTHIRDKLKQQIFFS